MIFKKYIFYVLTFINLLIFYFMFYSKLTLSNNFKTKSFDEAKKSEFIKIFGYYYKSSSFKNNYFRSFQAFFLHSSDNLALKSKINSVLFQNKAFLIENANLSFFNQRFFFTYGLEIKFLPSILKTFESSNFPCEIVITSSHYLNENITAAIYIKCKMFTIHIPVFYPRGNFFWIPADDYQLDGQIKLLNDHQRALNKFQTKAVQIGNQNYVIPNDFDQFMFDLNRSKFIECNLDMAKANSIENPQDKVKDVFFSYRLLHIKEILETNKKDYWLTAGTLLGWYRDCGIIPHTTDGDIGLLANQYDFNLENAFLKSNKVPMTKKLGFINDSLEFRVGNEDFPVDLFFNYIYNQTHMMYSTQAYRHVYRIFLTRLKNLCSAELFGEKFFVPCNPDLMLDEIYGKYLWTKIENKNQISPTNLFWKSWSLDEWKNVVKFYDSGKFLENTTLNFINAHI